MAETKNTFRDTLLRVVALLGLLAVLVLGAWGIIQVAFMISGLFTGGEGPSSPSSSAPAAHEIITISVPSSVLPGQTLPVSWQHQGGAGAYAYAVSYSCADGLSMKAPLPTGALQTVPCNTKFNYVNATSSMALTAVYSGSSDAHTAVTVTATRLSTGAVTATATSTLTVSSAKKAPAPSSSRTTGTPASTYYPSGRTSSLYGSPDLAVTITSAYSRYGNSIVTFTIQNVGTNAAPSGWTFDASIPWQGTYTYPSGPQRALYPGDRIEYTLAFGGDSSYPNCFGYTGNCFGSYGYGQNTVSIAVDPYNRLSELNKINNYASATYAAN